MLCCFAKSVFYFGLMAYHVADTYFDWQGYIKLGDKEAFSAIPKDSALADGFYFTSCITGTFLSIMMLVAYGFYIWFHISCMCTSDQCDKKKCNRHFLMLELGISVGELLFKDDIQSILMFLIYDSGVASSECVSPLTKAFAICSIVAHLKLLVCFVTKLCGLGSGEKCDSQIKCFLCVLGCAGSLIFLIFTSLYFAEIQNASSCEITL